MRYYVTLGADSSAQPVADGAASGQHVVDVVELPNGTLDVRIDGRPVELDAVPVGNQLSVRVGGQVIDLTARGTLPRIDVSVSGYRSRVRVESDRTRSAERAGKEGAASGEKVVKSPMPGRVVKVLVGKGEVVQPGQGLVVLEAMKMENEVSTRAAGTVAEVHVTAGAAVERNTPLITLV